MCAKDGFANAVVSVAAEAAFNVPDWRQGDVLSQSKVQSQNLIKSAPDSGAGQARGRTKDDSQDGIQLVSFAYKHA